MALKKHDVFEIFLAKITFELYDVVEHLSMDSAKLTKWAVSVGAQRAHGSEL